MKTAFIPALIKGEKEPYYEVVMVQKYGDADGDNLWIKTPLETIIIPVEPIEEMLNE